MTQLTEEFKTAKDDVQTEMKQHAKTIARFIRDAEDDDQRRERLEGACQQAIDGIGATAAVFSKIHGDVDEMVEEDEGGELAKEFDNATRNVARSLDTLIRIIAIARAEKTLVGGQDFEEA